MGRKYKLEKAGRWVQPIKKGYRMACCDCGLVHIVEFAHVPWRNGGRKIIFRMWRDNRATAAMRREKGTP